MSKICAITGKRPVTGGRIIHKGVSKKAGGIGLQLVKNNKRVFRPNLQRSTCQITFRTDKAHMGFSKSHQGRQDSKSIALLSKSFQVCCGT